MAERTKQRTHREDSEVTGVTETTGAAGATGETEPDPDASGDADFDALLEAHQPPGSTTDGSSTGRLERIFSVKRFLAGLILVTAGSIVAGGVVPVAGPLVGIFLAAFVFGLASSTRPMMEASTAGGLVAGVSALVGSLVIALTGVGVPFAVVAALLGAIAGGFGAYLGSDLRDGLTREIP